MPQDVDAGAGEGAVVLCFRCLSAGRRRAVSAAALAEGGLRKVRGTHLCGVRMFC